MDNPPSFSLGITQLDATVEYIPLGFVPATFDEQDLDWAENRSKHRNDPITMNKLRDKAASKSKKSTSKERSISTCLLMLEIKQDNKDKLHVWVQREILKFTMLEFAIITSLKCTGNIDDYMYTSSSKSVLMSRYFPNNKGAITRSKLITRVQMENFDNVEDALNLAILFFVHTFMFSQHKKAPISVAHFQIIGDGQYIQFPWEKVTFEKLMSSWQQDFNTAKQLYSLSGMLHVLNVWMFECCPKNIQPTTDEVSWLDLSFSKDFETCDPTTYASTSNSGKLKRTTAELEQHVGTIAEEFGDFRTIPLRKILIKASFALPVSPDQSLKKRKTVMFEQDNQAVMDDDSSGRGHAVHHGSSLYRETHKDAADKGEIGVSEIQNHHHHREIGVSSQSHQYKSVPSSSTQPEETSKSSLDGDEIKNYINKCEEKIDEQQQSQEDGSNKQERPHKEDMQREYYDKGSLKDMEVSHDEESNKKHILEEQQLLDVNAADKAAGREDNLENEDCSDLQDLEDVNQIAKEDVNEVNSKNHESTDVTDVQVQEVQASKAKAPAKRERKKSRVLRSPYFSKYDSDSKDAVDFDKKKKLKYAFDGYTINQDLLNELMIDYSQWIVVGLLKTYSTKKEKDNHYRVNASGLGYRKLDFVVVYPQSKNWFYLTSESELAVELSTQQDYAESIVVAMNKDAIANRIHEFCMPTGLPWYMVDEIYVLINSDKEFHWVFAMIFLKKRLIRVYDSLSSKRKKEPPTEIQKLAVMLPTYLLDNGFYDKTERTDWPSVEACKGKITQQTCLVNEIPFDIDYVQNIPQQAYDNLDCGVFVCAYAKILSEGLEVHSCGFDAAIQRACYASLLWHYGVEKLNEGYTSDNGDLPRPRKSVIEQN
ncbi:hypothetical protein CQW23_25680 [Capsicum baccatum]|uniref:Ubiquitin-like protease family profile domain-containing protein n=1 Tax=Capsicum baccatum TaxID=33114 RepID=A0A2G2VLN6_CAPBA|nr:hypothetical protein CQW23_25680 [Capsicum baccatum]